MNAIYKSTMPPLLAALAALGRWQMQGSGNVYTDFGKDFYLPDPDLGWRLTSSSTLWLGLDAVLLCAAILVGLLGFEFLLRWSERARAGKRRRVRLGLQVIGVATLVVPALAFASGFAPSGARDKLPKENFVAAPSAGVAGSLPTLPAGHYLVQAGEGTQITATVKAGGETFEARFQEAPAGGLRLDPKQLSQPMSAEVSFASASIDTGIELRSKHAREELKSEEFPRIGFSLQRILGSAQESPNKISFTAEGELSLMGRTHLVSVAGTLTAPEEAGKKRLGFSGQDILIAKAAFSLSIEESVIENDGSYDADTIPIQVSLVLVRANKP